MGQRQIDLGGATAAGFEIDLPQAPLVVARVEQGYVMCGYLNLAVADKFGQAAAIVRGVKNLDELLQKPVTDVSAKAKLLGVEVGMSGLNALKKLSQ